MPEMPQPGELFAQRYRIQRTLGEGGMGVVLAAWDERDRRAVALKLLRTRDLASVKRFEREARSTRRLVSAHVVKVLEAGTAVHANDDVPYLVMEQLVGMNLSEYVRTRGGQLPLQEVADIAIQACAALAHAHVAGIVHRDVKPSNVFLHREAGHAIVKVLDFGISKPMSREIWENTITTTNDGILGSPPYMSPEHVRDPSSVDLRTDVWSLGVLLCKLVTDSHPFEGGSVGEIFAAILVGDPPDLRALPPAIVPIVRRCLARERSARFPSTRALALALAPLASPVLRGIVATMPEPTRASDVGDEPRTMTFGGEAEPTKHVLATSGGLLEDDTIKDAAFVSGALPKRAKRFGLTIGVAASAVVAVVFGLGFAWRGARHEPRTKPLALVQPASSSVPSASGLLPVPSGEGEAIPRPRTSANIEAAAPSATAGRAHGPISRTSGKPELQGNPYPVK